MKLIIIRDTYQVTREPCMGEEQHPTDPFTILDPKDQEIEEVHLVKFVKGSVGQRARGPRTTARSCQCQPRHEC